MTAQADHRRLGRRSVGPSTSPVGRRSSTSPPSSGPRWPGCSPASAWPATASKLAARPSMQRRRRRPRRPAGGAAAPAAATAALGAVWTALGGIDVDEVAQTRRNRLRPRRRRRPTLGHAGAERRVTTGSTSRFSPAVPAVRRAARHHAQDGVGRRRRRAARRSGSGLWVLRTAARQHRRRRDHRALRPAQGASARPTCRSPTGASPSPPTGARACASGSTSRCRRSCRLRWRPPGGDRHRGRPRGAGVAALVSVEPPSFSFLPMGGFRLFSCSGGVPRASPRGVALCGRSPRSTVSGPPSPAGHDVGSSSSRGVVARVP